MCLGIPGQVTKIWQSPSSGLMMAMVDFGGVGKEICLSFTPEVNLGDYVMVHVGFAISRIDEVEAERTLALVRETGGLAELG